MRATGYEMRSSAQLAFMPRDLVEEEEYSCLGNSCCCR